MKFDLFRLVAEEMPSKLPNAKRLTDAIIDVFNKIFVYDYHERITI
jgi:hypothetical protein